MKVLTMIRFKKVSAFYQVSGISYIGKFNWLMKILKNCYTRSVEKWVRPDIFFHILITIQFSTFLNFL